MFTGCNALLPNEIGPAEALPISPRNPRGANVGYQTESLTSGRFTMFTVPFNHVSNDGKGLMLGTDIQFENIYGDEEYSYVKSDQCRIWNGLNGYDIFFYFPGYTADPADPEDEDMAAGWYHFTEDTLFAETEGFENGLKEGQSIYFKAVTGEGKTATGSGAVESEPEYEVPLTSGRFTMYGNPYPVATFLNDKDSVEFVNIYGDEEYSYVKSDQCRIWNGLNGYDIFFYFPGYTADPADPEDEDMAAGWYHFTEDTLFEETEGFENGLKPGSAIYFKAVEGAGKKMIFKSPLAK